MHTGIQRALGEFAGTAALTATVVGSGIMAERLSDGNAAIALMANTAATAAALLVLIRILSPLSGAHFNPVVTITETFARRFPGKIALLYLLAQPLGAIAGSLLANAMFDLPLFQISTKLRVSPGSLLSEVVATAGLLLVIRKSDANTAATHVALYITAAYWFTASTSFANPAVTVGRILSDTFAGIAPASAIAFIPAQIIGALLGILLHKLLAHRNPLKKDAP
jgi:glycerol uptake facilitator-like aquaporin